MLYHLLEERIGTFVFWEVNGKIYYLLFSVICYTIYVCLKMSCFNYTCVESFLFDQLQNTKTSFYHIGF